MMSRYEKLIIPSSEKVTVYSSILPRQKDRLKPVGVSNLFKESAEKKVKVCSSEKQCTHEKRPHSKLLANGQQVKTRMNCNHLSKNGRINKKVTVPPRKQPEVTVFKDCKDIYAFPQMPHAFIYSDDRINNNVQEHKKLVRFSDDQTYKEEADLYSAKHEDIVDSVMNSCPLCNKIFISKSNESNLSDSYLKKAAADSDLHLSIPYEPKTEFVRQLKNDLEQYHWKPGHYKMTNSYEIGKNRSLGLSTEGMHYFGQNDRLFLDYLSYGNCQGDGTADGRNKHLYHITLGIPKPEQRNCRRHYEKRDPSCSMALEDHLF